MAKRARQNELKIYLSDDEQYILEQKWKASNMKSKSAFIRHLILYGYVYDVNYEHLREYNTILSRIGNSLNQIAKRMNATGNVYEADVKEVKELMKQVWQSQKSMLSKSRKSKRIHKMGTIFPILMQDHNITDRQGMPSVIFRQDGILK